MSRLGSCFVVALSSLVAGCGDDVASTGADGMAANAGAGGAGAGGGGGSGGSGGAGVTGYDQAISYTQTRPPFTPLRTVHVSSASELKNAIANLQAGDLVQATAPFTVSGETVISKALSSWAVLDLGSHVTFEYSGGSDVPAVYINRSSHLRIYGGIATTDRTGGGCILSHGLDHVLWWGFYAHDCGGTGLSMFPVTDGGAITNNDFQGEITRAGLNLAWDPHAEKGTGLHGANLDDSGLYPFTDNRFALYVHDEPAGACIEYGSNDVPPVRNTIILKCVNETDVSTTQTGGNAIQFWGVAGQAADIKYLEASNLQGFALYDHGMYSGATLHGVTVEYGRAAKTNLNPRYAGQNPWQKGKGEVYQDVLPAP
jgi:hypothetical protein